MKLTKNTVFLHYFSKFMGILLFALKYMYISLLLKMVNGFSWPAKIMASPFNIQSLYRATICIRAYIWKRKLSITRYAMHAMGDSQAIFCKFTQLQKLITLWNCNTLNTPISEKFAIFDNNFLETYSLWVINLSFLIKSPKTWSWHIKIFMGLLVRSSSELQMRVLRGNYTSRLGIFIL